MTDIAAATVWWDNGLRLWTLQWLDKDSNQIGEAEYDARKAPLLVRAREHAPLLYVGSRMEAPVIPEPEAAPDETSPLRLHL